MGECSFWYRPTRVVPDQRPLNGRCCVVCIYVVYIASDKGIIKENTVAAAAAAATTTTTITNRSSAPTSKTTLFLSSDKTLSSEPELVICSDGNLLCKSGLRCGASRTDAGATDDVTPRRSRSSTPLPPYRAATHNACMYATKVRRYN